jgi:hypothetical protein
VKYAIVIMAVVAASSYYFTSANAEEVTAALIVVCGFLWGAGVDVSERIYKIEQRLDDLERRND